MKYHLVDREKGQKIVDKWKKKGLIYRQITGADILRDKKNNGMFALSWFDHLGSFKDIKTGEIIPFIEPYGITKKQERELKKFCDDNGLIAISTKDSPWYFGNTILIYFIKRFSIFSSVKKLIRSFMTAI